MDPGSILAISEKGITMMLDVVGRRMSAHLGPYTQPFAEMRSVQFPYRDCGGTIVIVARNPLPEAVRVRAVGLLSPRNGKLAESWSTWKPRSGGLWPRHGELELSRDLAPGGDETLLLELHPPKEWDGGRITLSVRFQLTTSGTMREAIVTKEVGPRP